MEVSGCQERLCAILQEFLEVQRTLSGKMVIQTLAMAERFKYV